MNSDYDLRYYEIYIYSLCFAESSLDTSDPSWISAWWIGYLIAAIAYIIIAFPLLMLPASEKRADTIGAGINIKNKKTKRSELEELRQYQNQGLSVMASAKGNASC